MNRYNFVLDTLQAAGKVLIEAKSNTFKVEKKDESERNLVTSVDMIVNNFLTEEVKKSFPGEQIYSEEVDKTYSLDDSFWCIDPIDGTSNFIKDIPHYAICLSYFSKGKVVCGGAFNPITNELFSVETGVGAFYNGQNVKSSDITNLAKSTIIMHSGRADDLRVWASEVYKKLIFSIKSMKSLGSSALDFCYVGSGRAEACLYAQVTVFDIVFAISFIQEAGGIVTDGEYNPIQLSFSKQKVLAFANQQILEEIKKLGV